LDDGGGCCRCRLDEADDLVDDVTESLSVAMATRTARGGAAVMIGGGRAPPRAAGAEPSR